MNVNDTIQPIEWHQIALDYQNVRIRTKRTIERLAVSMSQFGQLQPIFVCQSSTPQMWVVIDGYQRVQAWRSLGNDTINAQCCQNDSISGLTYYMLQQQSRAFQAIEEASLLQIILSKESISQTQIAQHLGKSKSWVTQRLKLVNELPDFVYNAIYQGHISTWAARLFIPFARANDEHAKQLIDYVSSCPRSTRELEAFYVHYMRSNRKIRADMSNNPELFFNTSVHQGSKNNKSLNCTPDVRWCNVLTTICVQLKQVEADIAHVFYAKQPEAEKNKLLEPLESIQTCLESINHTIRSINDD